MPFLNYLSIGSIALLLAMVGWLKISNVSLEKDLIVVNQQKEEWKKSDEALRIKLTDVESSARRANDLNNEYIKTVKDMQDDYTQLQEDLRDAHQQTEKLSRIFAEHDFEYLLKAKPGLMQRRIRSGTIGVFNRFVPERDSPSTATDNN